jgi:hypothetical protein
VDGQSYVVKYYTSGNITQSFKPSQGDVFGAICMSFNSLFRSRGRGTVSHTSINRRWPTRRCLTLASDSGFGRSTRLAPLALFFSQGSDCRQDCVA